MDARRKSASRYTASNMISDWDTLLQFQSSELVAQKFRKRHKRKLNSGKSQSIAAAVLQSREYFRSSQQSDISVRPLLLYYGVLTLSRALILFLDQNQSEASLKKSHGLEVLNWQDQLSKGWAEVNGLCVRVTTGTFKELLTATKNYSYLRLGSSGVGGKIAFDSPTNKTVFSFGEVTRCFPDLKTEWEAWMGKPYQYTRLKSYSPVDGGFKSMVSRKEDLDDIFPFALAGETTVLEQKHQFQVKGKKSFVPFMVQNFGDHLGLSRAAGIGDVWLIPPMDDDAEINTIGSLFIAAYTLGMLVRYYPSVWSTLGVGKGNSIAPIVHQLLVFIEEKYPRVVVDHLRAPYPFE